jgi:SnoaL-like protein
MQEPGQSDRDRRLQRLEDREAVWQLLMDYARCLDRADFAAYAELFHEDGELVLHPPLKTAAGDVGSVTGPVAIAALLSESLQGTVHGAALQQHLVCNAVIDVDGDRATGESTWCYITSSQSDGEPVLAALGHYRDVLARVGGSWRFLRREVWRDTPFRAES